MCSLARVQPAASESSAADVGESGPAPGVLVPFTQVLVWPDKREFSKKKRSLPSAVTVTFMFHWHRGSGTKQKTQKTPNFVDMWL